MTEAPNNVDSRRGETRSPGPGPDAGAEPVFVSYSQHGEDVVLWRALRHVTPGTYVDVGASDPSADSVTRALYERGWRGIDVEPVPETAEALRSARPRDIVVECAAGSQGGNLLLFEVEGTGTGLSTVRAEHARSAAAGGHTVTERTVPVRRLDDILEAHWDPGLAIHFLKIDVEGAEADVLAGTDLDRWRPWVVVVEATEPNSTRSSRDSFEYLLTKSGYRATMFDGLNVYYVSPDHPELEHALSYQAGLPDRYVTAMMNTVMERWGRADARAAEWKQRWAAASAETVESRAQARREIRQMRRRVRNLKRSREAADDALRRMQRTPMRRLARAGRRTLSKFRPQASRPDSGTALVANRPGPQPEDRLRKKAPAPANASTNPVEVVSTRLRSVLVANDVRIDPSAGMPELLTATADLLEGSEDPDSIIWLLHVVLVSRFPSMDEMQRFLARLALDGTASVIDDLRRAGLSDEPTWATTAPIRIVTGRPVIDATHTASHNLHTGIQRVAREVVPRWLAQHDATLVVLDDIALVYRQPTESERLRVVAWDGPQFADAEPLDFEIIVPWRTTVIVPELAVERGRSPRLQALASTSDICLILFDLIPLTMPSACSDGMRHAFGEFVMLARRAKRMSTISHAVADDMTGFAVAFHNQAIATPQIEAQPLPIEAPTVSASVVERLKPSVLGVPGLPLILSVSSIEPRKNQLSILLAAESLWREGHQFQLLFIAGSGWERAGFDRVFEELQHRGRAVRVVSGTDEEFLWSAYQLARFTVFVSITEGFGLPAAESIATGTPVVLSNHGPMREIGEGGGAEFVNAHDQADITNAMRRLLTDDNRLAELAQQAVGRESPTWDDYATDTWNWLVEGKRSN